METSAPSGYLKSVTYFHIGQMGEDETKPDEIGSYTTIPLNGGTHQIPNYKASIRLHKMDEKTGDSSYLAGAEFALYDNPDCSGESLAVAKEDRTGIYSFDLAGLTAGKSYYLKETKAPAGYNLSDTVYTVTFDQEGNVTLKKGDEDVGADSSGAYLIANKSGYQLPETGGPGTARYTLSAIALMAGAVLWGLARRKKKDFVR